MCKQKRTGVGASVADQKELEQLQVTRMTFVCLVLMVVQGGQAGIHDFLKDKSPRAIMDYAEIWDRCKDAPIGEVVQRPAFELYRELAKCRSL